MKVRVVKTVLKAQTVQVGSAHTKKALNELMILAEEWIKDYTG